MNDQTPLATEWRHRVTGQRVHAWRVKGPHDWATVHAIQAVGRNRFTYYSTKPVPGDGPEYLTGFSVSNYKDNWPSAVISHGELGDWVVASPKFIVWRVVPNIAFAPFYEQVLPVAAPAEIRQGDVPEWVDALLGTPVDASPLLFRRAGQHLWIGVHTDKDHLVRPTLEQAEAFAQGILSGAANVRADAPEQARSAPACDTAQPGASDGDDVPAGLQRAPARHIQHRGRVDLVTICDPDVGDQWSLADILQAVSDYVRSLGDEGDVSHVSVHYGEPIGWSVDIYGWSGLPDLP